MLLATSLVAVALPISASVVRTFTVHLQESGMQPTVMANIAAHIVGTLLAHYISVHLPMRSAAIATHYESHT